MTTKLEKRAKEYAEARAGKRPEDEMMLPISYLTLWIRDENLMEEAYIAGAKSERERCLKAVAEEPEMPGPMPTAMWAQIKTLVLQNDQDGLGECLRIIVRLTKSEIQKRIVKGDE